MLIEQPVEMKAALAPRARLLGFDLGSKTIGLAVSDSMLMVSSPLETLRRTKFTADAEKLLTLIVEKDVGGIVLGLPRNMDGSEGPRAQSTRAFANNMAGKTDLPITFWDERLTTAEAERVLIDQADMNRKRRGEVIDKMAASIILQNFLDFLRNTG
ncbi:MAG: Holliday junction resolvase RuvX [Rhodospirillaceae bacterium]|jgi:putative Holliday junction resolvase|nr:Holliday junction resolvase RuvX [Rhodospirillaceae bacterium]MBT3811162.1 Holliday junction resolvase RuvX [Rhodospirillaceae bacterium]MBT3931697.1 Holliday junction resolvase RuvX [Rhodospirillaceae bacterium]MBT4773908.1 Holliday junction resolvase RuvX [Rhodospirillaceae bacterium]MBT5357475.1 Holliday junction resolvase RuvX [Rhodospirillaceae bacterium]